MKKNNNTLNRRTGKILLTGLLSTSLLLTAAMPAFAEQYSDSSNGGHAIEVSQGSATYDNPVITKTGDSSGEEADFYGYNAAVLADGGTITINGGTITTDGTHANAVFSYGENSTINISDTVIVTEGNNSGGLMTTGGGTMNAEDVTVTTYGNSSAAIRSDRGGGDVNVSGGSFTTYGVGSPAVYSTADIDIENAELTSYASEAIVIEGANSVSLTDSTVTGNNTTLNGQATEYNTIFIYQSMSGDADEGTAEFDMTGGTLISNEGNVFYVTNTDAEIHLEDVTIVNNGDGDLLKIEAAAWGTSGSNGGNVVFTAVDQTLEGDITVDDISSLDLILQGTSTFTGSINSSGEAGEVYVELEDGTVWTLTADSYITSLVCSEDSIILNGYVLYVNGEAYVVGTVSTGSSTSSSSSADNSSSESADMFQPAGGPEKPGAAEMGFTDMEFTDMEFNDQDFAPAADSVEIPEEVLSAVADLTDGETVVTVIPMTKVDTVQDFVSRLFKSILDRDAEAAELDSYISALEDGQMSGSDLVKELVNSEESVTDTLDDRAFADVLFSGVLGRDEADGFRNTAEYNEYVTRLLNGTAREEILDTFLNSTLFNNYCTLIGIQAK